MTTTRQLAWLLLGLVGCGGATARSGFLPPEFPDNDASAIAEVVTAVRASADANLPALAVGVTRDPSTVFAYDLSARRALWEQPTATRTVPHLAGRFVLVQEPHGVVVRDAASGRALQTFEDEALHLVGADGDAERFVAVLSTGGGVGARSRVVVGSGEDIAWAQHVEAAVGIPAMAGGYVFIPWSSQNLSIVRADDGAEVSRLRLHTSVIGAAWIHGGSVYFGQDAVFRLDPSVAAESHAPSSYFQPDLSSLPGQPKLVRNAYAPPPSATSAAHRIRVAWSPSAAGGAPGAPNERVYSSFYRVIFALDSAIRGVRWVREHDEDVVGTTATDDGLWIADATGRVSFVSTNNGEHAEYASLGVRPTYVILRAGALASPTVDPRESLPIRDQLVAVAQSTDARLAPAGAYAVAQLSEVRDEGVTESLVALCDRPRIVQQVRSAACAALAGRTLGANEVLSALARHGGFLEGTTPPPVGALARAAARMRETRAIPHLLAHLRDPDTTSEDLALIATALRDLGDRQAAEPLADFLRLYHAEAPDDAFARALGLAAEALVALSGPAAMETLRAIGEDPMAMPALRERIAEILAGLAETAARAAAEPAGTETPSTEGPATPSATTPTAEGAVDAVLAPIARELATCVRAAPDRPRSARILLTIEGDGTLSRISVTPESTRGCIEGLLRQRAFTSPSGARFTASHTVRR